MEGEEDLFYRGGNGNVIREGDDFLCRALLRGIMIDNRSTPIDHRSIAGGIDVGMAGSLR